MIQQTKLCKWCNNEKNLSSFDKDISRKSGYKEKCKQCRKERKIYLIKNRPRLPLTKKKCFRCKEIKDIEDFYTNISTISGYVEYCKICQNNYYKNNTNRKVYMKNYHIKNKEKILLRSKVWYKENEERVKPRHKKYYNDMYKKINQERGRKLKQEIIDAYGRSCVCCGETDFEFLTIDHKHNDGAQHRKEIGITGGIYKWLKNNNFPQDKFQLLCWNCNCAKGKYGYCPHSRSFGVI